MRKILFFIVFTASITHCINKDGEFYNPLHQKKETDKKVCGALYIYCKDQNQECSAGNLENQEVCSKNYQTCIYSVKACISKDNKVNEI
ncbi:hypothetical protein [Leptospira idonii]|uniref:Uncharacterized protein n=1 Tax=Leptospira idonii TaxID=1193500 RepID=A0A4R9LZ87_9LEPT|nr:hypothetical protein [Leptospira idonii]TGN18657.1 hypothetical protein EHS15_14890 [Leptospira idonii]